MRLSALRFCMSSLLSKTYQRYPDLKNVGSESLSNYLKFMSSYGFHYQQAAEMVALHPVLLKSHTETVPKSLDAWRSLGCNHEDITVILTQHPQLTDYKPAKLFTRFGILSKFFTRQESLHAIESCYEVLVDRTVDLEKKMTYLIQDLSHRPALIAKSNTLAYPLFHIQCRHEFLIRSGIFIAVSHYKLHKKAYSIHPRLTRPNYFPPADIVCTNDLDFVKICTNNMLTVNELAAFEEVFEKEVIASADLIGEDEEDEDLESESEDENDANARTNSSVFFNAKDSSEFYY